jgi:hypothetical protein
MVTGWSQFETGIIGTKRGHGLFPLAIRARSDIGALEVTEQGQSRLVSQYTNLHEQSTTARSYLKPDLG